MLTNEEKALLEMSVDLWNGFVALPNLHPCDADEMMRDIHAIQNRIMARVACRTDPEMFNREGDN